MNRRAPELLSTRKALPFSATRRLGASLFFLILVLTIFDQGEGVAIQDRLQFDLDWASFKYDSERSYVEIYYSVPSRQLQIEEGKRQEGAVVFNVDLKIFKSDSIAFSRS